MKDITVIIPCHKLAEGNGEEMLHNAVNSTKKAAERYTHGSVAIKIVCPPEIADVCGKIDGAEVLVNDSGKTDFCSQVNFAVDHVDTEHFSVLEMDDTYYDHWFEAAHEYAEADESISLLMPLVSVNNVVSNQYYLLNEAVWASSFSKNLGFVDNDCIIHYQMFTLTGAIINTQDFIYAGKFKPSLGIAFAYEYIRRQLNVQLKAFVVPKIGYLHLWGREGSYSKQCLDTIPNDEIPEWFALADREFKYHDDRQQPIASRKK